MAIYTTALDPATGVTHIAVDGDMLADDLKAYMESGEFARRCNKVFCDLTNTTFSNISTEEVINLARNVQHLSRPGIKAAYLVNKSVDMGILNIFKVYAEQLRYQATLEIFTNREKSMQWLLDLDAQ